MRAALLLLLAALVASAAAAQWTVYVQGTDPNGEWGFLNFYPQALTINPGDNVTFVQYHDAGIIVMLNDSSTLPSSFYEPQPAACAGKCVALTPYSVPTGGGPLSNANARFTHVTNLQGPFSAGFIGALGQVPPFVPDRWTFYFDPAILGSANTEVAVKFWEVLHAMSIQIRINPSPGAIVKTPAEIDALAKTQIQTDANLAPTIFASTVTPVNGIIFNNEICSWVVHTGAQVASSPTNNGYGIGSFDRFLPFDANLRKSNIDINQGDSINFLQITPHGHAVSIYGQNTPFNDSTLGASYLPSANTLVQSLVHFIPTPTPVNGVIHFDGTQAVTGPLIVPGQNATVKFDCAPGTYYIFCIFHQSVNMVGTITVKNGTVSYPSGTPGKCKAAGSFALTQYPMAALIALLVAMLL